ncbi:hypothetical protein SETIT_8G047100v2 [Setaria italica]|uniref:Uncharacterized protein n=1 Tax=Setaria italica TaxID=4555 RepID=A0A368S451_SETIT|nr:hypothetical protein SETIT_8G047100v2 [Setaria italica]
MRLRRLGQHRRAGDNRLLMYVGRDVIACLHRKIKIGTVYWPTLPWALIRCFYMVLLSHCAVQVLQKLVNTSLVGPLSCFKEEAKGKRLPVTYKRKGIIFIVNFGERKRVKETKTIIELGIPAPWT